MDKQDTMTLREKIADKRHTALIAMTIDVAADGVLTGLVIAGTLPRLRTLPFIIWQTAAIIAGARTAWHTTQALRIYDGNPLAAYAAEIQHTFGTEGT